MTIKAQLELLREIVRAETRIPAQGKHQMEAEVSAGDKRVTFHVGTSYQHLVVRYHVRGGKVVGVIDRLGAQTLPELPTLIQNMEIAVSIHEQWLARTKPRKSKPTPANDSKLAARHHSAAWRDYGMDP